MGMAWVGVPSGTSTLSDIVTDTAIAFATAISLGMGSRSRAYPQLQTIGGICQYCHLRHLYLWGIVKIVSTDQSPAASIWILNVGCLRGSAAHVIVEISRITITFRKFWQEPSSMARSCTQIRYTLRVSLRLSGKALGRSTWDWTKWYRLA